MGSMLTTLACSSYTEVMEIAETKPFVQSLELERRADQLFPGGVRLAGARLPRRRRRIRPSSPSAKAPTLFDADGNRYVDFFGSWGPMILGHAFPPVVEAIREAAGRRHQLRRLARRRGRPRGAGAPLLPFRREGALRQLRHRGLHVGHPPGARLHRPQLHHQVRGLLPRPRRRAAGEGRLRRGDAGHPRLGRRARRDGAAHAGAALQRPGRGRGGLRRAPGRDRLRHRRAGRRQRGHHRCPRPATSRGCARSARSTARC